MRAKLIYTDGYPVTHYRYDSKHNNGYGPLKIYLMEKYGVCYWCDRKVFYYGPRQPGVTYPDDEATIDHIISRFHRKKGDVVPKVLACAKCNTRRSVEEQNLFNKNKRESMNNQSTKHV